MDREEQLARLVDEAQLLVAEKGHVDVDAFVDSLPAEQAEDLGEELRELLDTVQMLRRSGGRGVVAPSRPLRRVAHYRIERELGRGGMGVVYLAWDEHLERWVALKVLPGLAAADATQRERFERESKAVARLVHPNIIPLYGAGEADGCLFLAMQYVEGDTLEQHVAKRGDQPIRNGTDSFQPGATTFRQLARIMRDVALGVDHAHRSRILHRDLKLANVILDPDGKPWVLDFGVCRFTEAESGTQTGSVLGTLRSMAPEQIDGKADERSDVYGLGLMLYELLTAQAPYEATQSSALIRSIQSDEPRRPRRVDRRIPADLETIARKAYAKLPGERYASADAFAQDLDAFADGRPISARAPGALYLARLFATRHKAIFAVLLLALAAVGMVGTRSLIEIGRERDLALYDAYDARMAGADAALARGEVRRALFQLDQAPPDHAGWEWKHLRVRADQTLARWRPLAGQTGPLTHIRFEPGGDRFAVGYLTALAVYGPGAASTGEAGGTIAEGPTQASLASYDVEWKSDVRALKSLEWLPDGEGWAVGNWPDAIASVHHGDDALGTFKERYAERLIRLGGEPTFTCPNEGLGMFTSTTKGTLHRWSPDEPAFETFQVGAVPLIWCGTGGLGESLGGLIRDTRPRAWTLSELGTFTGLDPRTGAAEHVVELGEGTGRVHLLHMDLEHESAILGDAAGAIRRVDLRTGRTVQRFRSVGGEVEVGALTSDGRRLISGGHHHEALNVHDTETGKLLGRLSGHSSFISSLEATPSGEIILTGDAEGTLAAWNPAFQSGVTHLSGHADDIWSVAVHSDGRRIATGGRDGLIIVWDLDLQAPVHMVRAPTFGVRDLEFLEPRNELIATSGDGHVYLLDLGTSAGFRAKDLERGQLYGVEWEPQQGRIYVATAKGLTVLNPELEVIEEVSGFARGLGSLCLSTEHGLLYSLTGLNHSDTSDTGSLICLDLATLETRWERKTRASGMVSLALNGDQSRLAILVDGDQILLLQPEDGTVLETLAQPSQGGTTEDLLRVAFGPGPDRLVATSTQGAVHFWDLNRRVPTLHLDAHERYATALVVVGDRVITGGSDRQINVWHHSTASELAARADRARKELEDAGRTPLHPPSRDEHIDWLWQAAASGDDRQVKAASTLHYSFSRRIGTAPHDPELLASGAALSLCWRTQRVHLETATRNLAWGLERMDPASPNRLRTASRLCAAHVRLGRPWHAVGVGARETFRTVLRTLLFGASQKSAHR